MNPKLLHIGTLAILAVGIYFLASYNSPNTFKCPDDYATNEEQIVAFDKWTNDFYDANPEATITDWSKARHQFWVDNNCTTSLERYQSAQDGTADPATMKMIDDALQEAINNAPSTQ